MTAIRVIFDGKTFVPQQAVTLPAQAEALVIVETSDPAQQAALDAATRAYYTQASSNDSIEDDAWGDATARESHRAWDED